MYEVVVSVVEILVYNSGMTSGRSAKRQLSSLDVQD
jgi:hypothetical protein